MGIAITGLTRAICPNCNSIMINFIHSSHEGQEMCCPKCKEWCYFEIKDFYNYWSPVSWDAKPPDIGKSTCDLKAWIEAVEEITKL